jgi:hypothetical protein
VAVALSSLDEAAAETLDPIDPELDGAAENTDDGMADTDGE